MMGRTHSVHAEPTTFGLKLRRLGVRGRPRPGAARRRRPTEIATGKISGPVGTYSHLGPDIEAEVLADLGLRVDPVSTQIVQRDRHAAFLAAIAIIGGSLERFATEVRNLQHTEIAEVMEPFRPGQKGSSAMPHKRNPILSERIAGLARLLRGYALAGFENQALWHERDISHSSAERVVAARRHDPARLHAGPDDRAWSRGSSSGRSGCARTSSAAWASTPRRGCCSRSWSDGGLSREDAYAIVQRNALRAADERVPLRELLATDPEVARSCRWPSSTPASTTRRSCATCRRSSPASIALERPHARAMLRLRRSSALGQGPRPVPRSTTTGCCWSRRTGSRRSTSCCPRRSRTRAACSPGCRASGSRETAVIVPNHLLSTDPADVPGDITGGDPDVVDDAARPDDARPPGRGAPDRVRRPRLPRRARAGRSTATTGPCAASRCPRGLRESDRLPEPIFTPATKAPMGEHDENIPFESVETLVGPELAARVRDTSLALYAHGAAACERAGIILADTKFEFGLLPSGELLLIDEVLTPDSSPLLGRRRPISPAAAQASFDKQYVRDWLLQQDWDQTAPGPELPLDVVAGTRARYVAAFERITGASFDRYLTEDVIAR